MMRGVAIPIALLLLATGLGTAVLLAQWHSLEARRQDVLRSRTVIQYSAAAITLALGAESAQRGYILTADDGYLAPFVEAREAMPETLAALREAITADRGDLIDNVDTIAELWAAKMVEMTDTIDLVRAGRVAEAVTLVREGEGKDIMSRMAEQARSLVADKNWQLGRQTDALVEGESWSRTTIVVGIGTAVLGLLASLIALGRANARLAGDADFQRSLASALRQARDDLSDRVDWTSDELARTLQRLDAALYSSGVLLTGQDRDLRYTFVRNWMLGDGGRSAGEVVGLTDAEVLPEPHGERLAARKRQVLESGESADFETNLPTPDGPLWLDVHLEPIRDEDGTVAGVTTVGVDITERRAREQHVRLLMRELAHRSKNTLAVVQAMMRQTAAGAADKDEFVARLEPRLSALGAAHTLLANDGWTGARLRDLVRSQLGHVLDLVDRQIFIEGPDLTLPIEMIQNIGLALHELSTNASKYGALSVPTGRVDISWDVAPRGREPDLVTIRWRESGGPPVSPPERRGFGRVVIERTVARAVGGEVALDYAPSGLTWQLVFAMPGQEDEG